VELSSTQKVALRRLRRRVNTPRDVVFGVFGVGLLRLVRRSDPIQAAELTARLTRCVGPWTKYHRIGRENLAMAFPEKSRAERDALLMRVWENLGRTVGEYPHLDRLWDFDWEHPHEGRIVSDDAAVFNQLRDDGRPGVIFAAHLGNWELPALLTALYGFKGGVVYRAPNNARLAAEVKRIREGLMGQLIPTGIEGVVMARSILEDGGHVGMLVDQHFRKGTPVTFFGRECLANPLLARLARLYDCPIVGVRVVRLPQHRFRIEAAGPIDPPRDARGRIDEQGTMQVITSIIEGWVREHPEQWLWLHRRWRKLSGSTRWATGGQVRRRSKRPYERDSA
jgi:Kdo2-lipid IVA lauroyltransferase/acyltransferase